MLLRQDPPFDLAYIATTHFLERIHPRTLVVNDPRGVRDSPEKLFVMDFPELMPPTLIARDKAAIEAFRAEHGEVVMKPLYGFGGASVFKVAVQDPNFGSLFDLFATTFREPWVIQKFLPAVALGDKRIILVDGEARGVVNRVPTGDDIRSNMVRGGAAKETELTEKERQICSTIGPELRRRGLLFVGIDVIDGYLTEINVTSPTGIRAIKKAWRTRSGGGDLGRDRGQSRQRRQFRRNPAGLAIAGPREDIPPMSDAEVPAVERRSRAAPPLKGVERAKLLDQFASLHEQHSKRPRRVPPRRRRDFASSA